VRLSLGLPCAGAWATPDNVATVARLADEHGFRGLWTFQRWLATPDLDGVYQSVLDPMIALSYAAAVTSRVRLGVAIVNGPFYSPVAVAKQFAALDVLSSGRFDGGVGLGWSPVEYAAAGVPMEHRGRRFDEWLDCLNVLLTGAEVSFDGEFYSVPASRIAPAPVQRPRPPVLVGGGAPAALRRAGVRGDGWVSSSRMSMPDVRSAVAAVRDAAGSAGKAPDAVRCVVRGVTRPTETAVDGADRRLLEGSLDQIRSDLADYAACGVDEVFLDLNFDSDRVGDPSADPAVGLELLSWLLPLAAEQF
jgi:probable F420-dependent oxidoreductase